MGFHHAIGHAAQQISELHARIHETFPLRDRSKEHQRQWQMACENFHRYRLPIFELMHRCRKEDMGSSQMLREFAIDFLECDPIFFRSGYFKEMLLNKLKRVPLTESEKKRLTSIMLDAIHRRGRREFRQYCRLAARVCDDVLLRDIALLQDAPDSGVRARARLMYGYISDCSG